MIFLDSFIAGKFSDDSWFSFNDMEVFNANYIM